MLKKVLWLIFATLLTAAASTEAANTQATYTVVKRDTLSKIGQRFCGTTESYRKISADNRISNPNLIYPGQVLTIQCDSTPIAVLNQDIQDRVEVSTTRTSLVPEFEVEASVVVVRSRVTTHAVYRVADHSNTIASVPAIQQRTQRVYQEVGNTRPFQIVGGSFDDEGPASMDFIKHMVYTLFGPEHYATAMAVFMAESGLNQEAIGWNCYYRNAFGKRKSKACKPKDRHKAWSVDCGIAQINVRGQDCRGYLDPVYNLMLAKRLFDERGFEPWVAHEKKMHKPFLERFTNFKPDGMLLATTYNNIGLARR
jgi:hypothetical protein